MLLFSQMTRTALLLLSHSLPRTQQHIHTHTQHSLLLLAFRLIMAAEMLDIIEDYLRKEKIEYDRLDGAVRHASPWWAFLCPPHMRMRVRVRVHSTLVDFCHWQS